MEHRDFCYWLQGFFELAKTNVLSPEQVCEIKEHLDSTFKKFPRGLQPEIRKPHNIDPGFTRCQLNSDQKPLIHYIHHASC